MRTLLFAADVERAEAFFRVMQDEGYRPDRRIVDPGEIAWDAHLKATAGCPIIFIDLALGVEVAGELCRRIAAIGGVVPPLLAIISEPKGDQIDPLIAAGANMYFPDDPQALRYRLRFLHKAVRTRSEFPRILQELHDSQVRYRRAESQVQALLERAPDAAIIHRDGRALWANSRAAALLGYARDEMIGRPMTEFVAPEHLQFLEQQVPIEHPALHRDGAQVPVMAFGMPTIYEGQSAFVVIARDLTEQRRLETQLLAAERHASLGRLAASVGHEINNPLMYVIGNLELAIRGLRATGGVSPDTLEMLDDALQGAERVRRIVEDLRVFSKSQGDTRTPVELSTLIESCLRMTAGETRARAGVVVELGPVPAVLANQARLAQVLTNLLLHAAQSIPEGRPDAHRITVSARLTAAGDVEVVVADTGVGIAPSQLPHVFEPFSAAASATGTGLGLSVCRMLVASQNGDIRLESEPGRGTRVTVRLEPATPRVADERPAGAAAEGRRWRILLVDDEPRIAELLCEHLAPHEITIATNGREALALIASAPEFDAIVCDLMMPGFGGIQVHEHLAGTRPGLEHRMVFMTGGAYTPIASSFLARVRNHCLEKPFDIPTLLEVIEEVATRSPRR